VEHVFAQKSVKINEAERKDWVKRHKRVAEYRLKYANKELVKEINELLNQMEEYIKNNNNFDKLFSEYLKLIENPEGDKDKIDYLGNLALLGLIENIKLQNDSFFDKRRKIIEMVESGRNIPVGTERVFFKSFPETGTSLDYWSKEDGIKYVNYMQQIVFAKESE